MGQKLTLGHKSDGQDDRDKEGPTENAMSSWLQFYFVQLQNLKRHGPVCPYCHLCPKVIQAHIFLSVIANTVRSGYFLIWH